MTKPHPVFFAIDFDRCLSKGEMFALLYMEILDELGVISYVEINAAKEEVEFRGESFQVVTYLRDVGLLDSELEQRVAEEFYLREKTIPHAIISYGESSWQELKIKAAGFEGVPHQIVSHPRKSDELRSWLKDDLYHLPPIFGGETAESIVLIDDKAIAFTDLPPRVHGYWMRAKDGSLILSQQGTVPDSVETVYDFKSVIEKEEKLT